MYFKMALQNVKRSMRDYLIYFLTLTFAICIFYSFNSIDAQSIMFEMNKSQAECMKSLNMLMSMVSIFVSLILAGLIIYANNFLIKKRKKELGIYMSLGMGKGKISKILLIETFLVGLIALASGLLLGIIASQGLSAVTAQLFKMGMKEYKFVISIGSIIKSTLYFGVIFIGVMCFNTWSISKYTLIELINADKKSEELPNNKPIVIIGSFMMSILCITLAYNIGLQVGLDIRDVRFTMMIGFGIIGTFLFFYSALGFIILITMKRPKTYLHKLNPFVLRQMQYKVNTHFVSMSVICLMLLLTIGMLSSGLGFKNVIEKDMEAGTPYDAGGKIYVEAEAEDVLYIAKTLKEIGFKIEPQDKVVLFNSYIAEKNGKSLFMQYADTDESRQAVEKLYDGMSIEAIKYSDYQKLLAIKGEQAEEMSANEVLVLSNVDDVKAVIENICKAHHQIQIDGKYYTVANKEPIARQFENIGIKINRMILVIPDEAAVKLPVYASQINVTYDKDDESAEERYFDLFSGFKNGKFNEQTTEFIIGYTKTEIYESNTNLTSMILFVGIYMGLIFLMASAALLALQQLSEAGDSKKHYEVLRKIGATQRDMKRTMFIQVLFYFMLPLIVAIVHSVVGMHIINDYLVAFGQPSSMSSALITGAVLILIYGGYFIATYSCYKGIIEE